MGWRFLGEAAWAARPGERELQFGGATETCRMCASLWTAASSAFDSLVIRRASTVVHACDMLSEPGFRCSAAGCKPI